MKLFKRKRLWLYIGFVIVIAAVLITICIIKLNANILIGVWESSDSIRRYTFDENTLTISSNVNDYSVLYGYYLKNKTTLVLQKGENISYYNLQIKGSEIVLSSADTDSPEILHRVYE